ncbi:MAG: hypothetical protein ACLT33_00915 [Lachnospira pectinoschiza]
MISTNPGENLKPLSKIASGGELSRIMLAIKTVMSEDADKTLIFDEIDAGISGKTASKVSNQLARLSLSHQIICITHLPQIAAMADAHYIIERVYTIIRPTVISRGSQEMIVLMKLPECYPVRHLQTLCLRMPKN